MSGMLKPDLLERIVAYEEGELDEEETVSLFQELVDSGLVWELQGSYGREAVRLMRAGKVLPRHLSTVPHRR